MAKQVFKLDFCGRNLQVETGEIAKQAGGSVVVRYEDTVVLSAATASKVTKDIDFFPLTVGFEEKLYSVGKIPGGFLRREGRPTEHATLSGRLIDRTLRPLFADGFRNEVQVVNTILSADNDCSPDMTAMFGASLSLCISDVPFNGPIAGVVVGYINETYVINPTLAELEKSSINLIVAGTKDAINMVESAAKEVSEDIMLEAMMFGHEYIKQLCEFQIEIVKAAGKQKMEVKLYAVDPELEAAVKASCETALRAAVSIQEKLVRYGTIDEIEAKAYAEFEAKTYDTDAIKAKTLKQVKEITHGIVADEVRRLISIDKIRPGRDARSTNCVPLNSQNRFIASRTRLSAVLPAVETQVLSVVYLRRLGRQPDHR